MASLRLVLRLVLLLAVIDRTRANDVKVTSCAANCTCTLSGRQNETLEIDCSNSIGANSSSVADEIDRLLADRESQLTYLSITNSPLELVPPLICRLTRLERLDLHGNRLVRLPLGCFNNMTNLQQFCAASNKITEIQDGLFDGMYNLHKLDLSFNRITTIGLNAFTAKAGLFSLNFTSIENNELTELEPWPLIRGQLVPGSFINLHSNNITNFTNRLGWSYRCGMKPEVIETLHLNVNPIRYLTDLADGWNITGIVNQLCLFGPNPQSPFILDLDYSLQICDCVDYIFYSMSALAQHIPLFVTQYCMFPVNLRHDRIINVPLDEFVCDIQQPVCPTDCECIKRPYNQTYIVRCPDASTMPTTLPDTRHPGPYHCRYELDFQGSKIDILDYRYYFNNTVTLDVSKSSLEQITEDAWRIISMVDFIDVSSNKLTVLPTILQSENLTFKSIGLYNNPWRCQCDDRWIRSWMTSLGAGLLRPDSVKCDSPKWLSGKSVLSVVNEDDFCFDPSREKLMKILKITISSSVGTLLLVVLLATSIYRYRLTLFVSFNLHPFDVDECLGEVMIYDVFLICAHRDHDAAIEILERLENGDIFEDGANRPASIRDGFKVCYHERNFLPGECIVDSIQMAIDKSKRVVCLLTNDFIRSEYCMLEFHAAWDRCLKMKKRRLVVIKWPEVDAFLGVDQSRRGRPRGLGNDQLGENLQSERVNLPNADESAADQQLDVESKNANDVLTFLSTYTYIDRSRENWWQQLIYALPTNRLGRLDDDELINA